MIPYDAHWLSRPLYEFGERAGAVAPGQDRRARRPAHGQEQREAGHAHRLHLELSPAGVLGERGRALGRRVGGKREQAEREREPACDGSKHRIVPPQSIWGAASPSRRPPWQRRQKPSEAPGRIVVVENRKRLWIPLCIRLADNWQAGGSRCQEGAVRYRFGEFELDGDAYTLLRGGRELALQPKVFDLLRLLVERRGRVVTKAELLDALWSGEHVNEGAVPWTIFHARRALGQGARRARADRDGAGARLPLGRERRGAAGRRSAARPARPPCFRSSGAAR